MRVLALGAKFMVSGIEIMGGCALRQSVFYNLSPLTTPGICLIPPVKDLALIYLSRELIELHLNLQGILVTRDLEMLQSADFSRHSGSSDQARITALKIPVTGFNRIV